ncbi:MAG: tRNA threonylcarbamoyladenosine dehydratase [Clostridia bacterium]|nr:tRNA threonylcarbamoyladenosine dehydratase [Clostridia bacterium]
MSNMYERTLALIGEEKLNKIKNACICVFGLGGVGSFVVESLARAGVGKLITVDSARVDITNLNRQIIALHSTIGMPKTEVISNRMLDINPSLNIISHQVFADETNIDGILDNEKIDYIIDAIDSVNSKIAIITYAAKHNINIISSMGTGNKLHPEKFEICDISKTSVCPLARKVRKLLQQTEVKKLDVLYSKELPAKHDKELLVPASISFVPSVAGLMISGYVINKIIEI